MTHNELLAKIDYYLQPTVELTGDDKIKNSAIGFLKALRAVVELHTPYGSEGNEFMCELCGSVIGWPCSTIKTIELNLQ